MSNDPLVTLPTATADSARIEEFLLQAVTVSGDDDFTVMTSHLITAGGKRQRPRFTIAAAAATMAEGVSVPDDVVKGGVAVELVQVGSLYHDDVLDEAEIRRNVDSVNARWDNVKAILAGDYLLAKASEISAGLGTDVVELLAITISELCRGQVTELRTAYDPGRTEDQYFESITGKTAALFSAATRIGGLVAKVPETQLHSLTEFGRLYGLAFQIMDDIGDLTLDEAQLGKPSGNDLIEGVYSLPVIRALQTDDAEKLMPYLRRDLSVADRDAALEVIRASPAITSAKDTAVGFVEKARDAILSVSDNTSAQALADTASHLLDSA